MDGAVGRPFMPRKPLDRPQRPHAQGICRWDGLIIPPADATWRTWGVGQSPTVFSLPVFSLVDFSVFPDGAETRRLARSGDGAA